MQELNPKRDLRGIWVKTVDKAQGTERPFVILDLPITQSLGFINSVKLCVGESRAREGMFIILHMGAIDQLADQKPRVLLRTMEYAKKNKLVV